MATYERTAEGFASALRSAEWMAKHHGRPYAIFVPRNDANHYATSLPSLVRSEDVAEGTRANLIHPDGSEEEMFKS